jgi:hypothetical protein
VAEPFLDLGDVRFMREWFEWLIEESLDFLKASGKLSAKGQERKSPAFAAALRPF